MTTPSDSTSSMTYYPPAPEVLEHFAFSACEELGPEFGDPEVARGFASFLNTVARIQANNLNRKANGEFTAHVE